jgi:3',5'-cyclic AMP phosphodiesterase CpdA
VLSKISKLFENKKFLAALATVFVCVVLWGGAWVMFASKGEPSDDEDFCKETSVFNVNDLPKLQFREGRDEFRILWFTDTHFDAILSKNNRTRDLMRQTIGKTDPDLIILTGDLAIGFVFNGPRVRNLVNFLDSFGVPYAAVLGNHDAEGWYDRNAVGRVWQEGKHSLFRMGPNNIHGVGNYAFNIVDHEGNFVYTMVGLDSGSYLDSKPFNLGGTYDYIRECQVDWYEWVMRGMKEENGGVPVPSKVFKHIPLHEHHYAVEYAIENDTVFLGERREKVHHSPIRTQLFDRAISLREEGAGNTTHILAGHEHLNYYAAPLNGIYLMYGLKTGPGNYHSHDLQGSTLLKLHLDNIAVPTMSGLLYRSRQTSIEFLKAGT